MEIKIGRNGMVKKDVALNSGLPIFDFSNYNPEEDEEMGIKVDYCTRKELAGYGLELTQFEQENLIVGFLKNKNYRGLLPLYSLQQILSRRS